MLLEVKYLCTKCTLKSNTAAARGMLVQASSRYSAASSILQAQACIIFCVICTRDSPLTLSPSESRPWWSSKLRRVQACNAFSRGPSIELRESKDACGRYHYIRHTFQVKMLMKRRGDVCML